MNKKELIEAVSKNIYHSVSKRDITTVVSSLFDTIQDTVAGGEKVVIVGFGAFEKRERKAREGHNPKTGERLEIPATSVPVFSAGKNFKEMVHDAS